MMKESLKKNIIKSKDKKKWNKPQIECISIIETLSDPYDPGRENGLGQFSGTAGPS